MAKKQTRRQYSDEFKRDAVRQIEAGVPVTELANKLGVATSVMSRWRAMAGLQAAKRGPKPKNGNGHAIPIDIVDETIASLQSKANGRANGHDLRGMVKDHYTTQPLNPSEREELVRLRRELARYKRILEAAL